MTEKKAPAEKKSRTKKIVHKSRMFLVGIGDRSGSMGAIIEEVRNGWNVLVEKQKKDAPDALVTFVQFDSSIDVIEKNTPIASVKALGADIFYARGSTALMDAVGVTINKVASDVHPEDRVLVQIMTDGYENASREYTTEDIKRLIAEKTAEGNWTFTFQGASEDQVLSAINLGIPRGNTQVYTPSVAGANVAMTHRTASTSNYAGQSVRSSSTFYSEVPAPDSEEK